MVLVSVYRTVLLTSSTHHWLFSAILLLGWIGDSKKMDSDNDSQAWNQLMRMFDICHLLT